MKLFEKMNKYLADQEVMYIKLHNLHWFIYGEGFFTLHAKFEELYNYTADIIDDVAERILAMGCTPVASLKKALLLTTVEELEDEGITKNDAMHQLVTDMEYWVKNTKEIISLAEEEGDVVTADLFTGYLSEYEKTLWMLRAYIK